jgi:hypothetical protein
MCSHQKIEFIREKLRKFLGSWRIYNISKCLTCQTEIEVATDFMVHGRGKNEERYPINRTEVISKKKIKV